MTSLLRSFWLASLLLLALAGCGGGGAPVPAAQAEQRRPLILAFGDSITAGYMPVGGFHQLRQDLSYLRELREAGDVITAAVGGATSAQGLALQAIWLAGLPADVVIVMFGINDAFVTGATPAQTSDNIDRILSKYPGARRVVLAPPLWAESTRAFQAALTEELRVRALVWGATFIDLYTPSADLRPWCTADRHPCEDWHRALGVQVTAALRPALAKH